MDDEHVRLYYSHMYITEFRFPQYFICLFKQNMWKNDLIICLEDFLFMVESRRNAFLMIDCSFISCRGMMCRRYMEAIFSSLKTWKKLPKGLFRGLSN